MKIREFVLAAGVLALGYGLQAQDINGTHQMPNRGFEEYVSESGETVPVGWHGFKTATGSYNTFSFNAADKTAEVRPGSVGSSSVILKPNSVLGIIANGSITTGRLNMGSSTATDASVNHAYTDRENSGFNHPIDMVPDSLVIWARFIPKNKSHLAQVRCLIHNDNRTQDPGTNMSEVVAEAKINPAYNDGQWTRYSKPYVFTGNTNDIRYMLMTANTNQSPGQGADGDALYVDDIFFVYNPKIKLADLPVKSYNLLQGAPVWEVNYTLSGTVQWNSDDEAKNRVVVELSDKNGSFDGEPLVMAAEESETSGSFTVQIPENLEQGYHYAIRIRTTERVVMDTIRNFVFVYKYKVEVSKEGEGEVSGSGEYEKGTEATLTATARGGWHFLYWVDSIGQIVSEESTYSFPVTGHRKLKAVFEINRYELTLSVEGDGTIEPQAGTYTYEHGNKVSITATPGEGQVLDGFYRGNNLLSKQSPYQVTVTQDDHIEVVFGKDQLRVSVSSNNTNLGTVSGGGRYDEGAAVTIRASVANRFCYFVAWVEMDGNTVKDTVSRELAYTIESLQESRTFVALFSEYYYTVSLDCQPAGAADLTGAGTFSAADGNRDITLQAYPKNGYVFMYWKKDGDDRRITDNPYAYIEGGRLDEDVHFIAYFREIQYKVAAQLANEQSGEIVSGPGSYRYGDEVKLEALPAEGYDFRAWEWESENGTESSPQNPYVFKVEKNMDFTARLTLRTYTVSLGVEPENLGITSGEGVYSHGDTIELSAFPVSGYVFSYWAVKEGINYTRVSEENPWVFTADRNRQYYAVFIPRPKVVSAVSIPEGVGSFTGTGNYQAGEYATVKANDVHGYHFAYWGKADSSRVSMSSTVRLLVTGDTVLRAFYQPNSFRLLVMTEGAQSEGAVCADTSSYFVMRNVEVGYGQEVVLKAKPQKEGYAFWQWRMEFTDENGVEHDTLYSKLDSIVCRVTGDAAYVAYFVPNAFSVKSGVLIDSANLILPDDCVKAVSRDEFGHVDNEGNYRSGNWVQLDAVAHPGYVFTRWVKTTGEEFIRDRDQLLITVVKDTCVFALFKPDTVSGEVVSGSYTDWGNVGITGEGRYGYGDTVTVTAFPEEGYEFAGWRMVEVKAPALYASSPYVSTEAVYSFVADRSFRMVAYFSPRKYKVVLQCEPAGAGVLTGAGVYEYQTDLMIRGAANYGYEFKEWIIEKAVAGQYDTLAAFALPLTVNRNITAKAVFDSVQLRWEVKSENILQGRIEGRCSGVAGLGSTVVMTAEPNPHYRFAAWKDASANEISVENELKVVLLSDTFLYACFAPQTVLLSAQSSDERRGYIERYTRRADYGSILSLQATPNPGYKFEKWTGARTPDRVLSTSSVIEVWMGGDTSLLAHFVPEKYKVELNLQPAGCGAVAVEAGTDTFAGQAMLDYGSEAELRAEPVAHYDFVEWKEGERSLEDGRVTISGPVSYTAVFAPKNYRVDLEVEPIGYGRVEGEGTFKFGQAARLKAEAGDRYVFVGWKSGEAWVTDEAEFDFYPVADTVLTAVFEVDSVRVDLESMWGGYTVGGGKYRTGTRAVIEAYAYRNYEFTAWLNENGRVVSTENPYSFEVGTNYSLHAEFSPMHLPVRVTSTVGGYVYGEGLMPYDSTVGIFAVADYGYVFEGWVSDDMELTAEQAARPYLCFDVRKEVAFEARFTPDKFSVTGEVSPLNTGKISGMGRVNYASELTLSAEPDANYEFVAWILDGKKVGTEPTLDITVNRDLHYIAVFEPKQVKAIVEAYPEQSGVLIGSGTYFYGDTVKLGIEPYTGYEAESWLDGDFKEISKSETFEYVLLKTDLFTASMKYVGAPVPPPVPVPGDTVRDTVYTSPEGLHFRLYPNPMGPSRLLTVELEASDLIYLRLYNMAGGVVYYRKVSNDGVNRAVIQLPASLGGHYIYELGLRGGACRRGKIVLL